MKTIKPGRYTGRCRVCGRRLNICMDGRMGSHPANGFTQATTSPCDGIGRMPVEGSERCSQCRVDVGQGRAHRLDCSNLKLTPTGKDTR